MSELIVPKEAKVVQGRIEDPDRLARVHGWTIPGWAGWIAVVVVGAALVLELVAIARGGRGLAAGGGERRPRAIIFYRQLLT
jgi:hypothetical protein